MAVSCQGVNGGSTTHDELVGALVQALEEMIPKGTNWSPLVRDRAERQVASMGTNALPILVAGVRDQGKRLFPDLSEVDRAHRLSLAFRALGPVAAPAIPVLREELLVETNTLFAAMALQGIGSESVGVFIEALTNASVNVRSAGVGSLAFFQDSPAIEYAIPGLLDCLLDEDASLRCLTATRLGYLQRVPEVVVPALIERMENDQNIVVRLAATKAIGQHGHAAHIATSALKRVQEEDDARLRKMAAWALEEIGAAENRDPSDSLPRVLDP